MEAKEIVIMAYDAAVMSESAWIKKYPMGIAYFTWRKAYFNKYGVGGIGQPDLPVTDYVKPQLMYNAG